MDAGRPRDIRVTDLTSRSSKSAGSARECRAAGRGTRRAATTSVVAVVVGEGVGRIFRSLAFVCSSRRSVHEPLHGRPRRGGARDRLGSGGALAEQQEHSTGRRAGRCAGRSDRDCRATNSIVEGFAALLEYDPDATAAENATAMSVSARNVVAAEVTRRFATRRPTSGGSRRRLDRTHRPRCSLDRPLDRGASNHLLNEIITPAHELVTIIEGEGSSPRTRDGSRNSSPTNIRRRRRSPSRGQPLYPYYFGIE